MLISHKHKFVFIEIEKTGSTSIRNMLENYFKKDVTIFTYPSRKFPLLHRHNTIKEAVESIPECKNYFKFSFVRNPWDREVSRFFWNTQKRDVLIKEINNLKIQSKSKIKNKQKQVEFFQKNFHIRNIQKEQSTYLCVGEEIAVDFVGENRHQCRYLISASSDVITSALLAVCTCVLHVELFGLCCLSNGNTHNLVVGSWCPHQTTLVL